MQGGVQNYLGNQKMVEAPLHWQSAPDHPITELAYITKKEKDLLIKKDLHKSLKGGVNRGPSGIMSLNGWGSRDAAQNRAGADISASMDRSGSDSGWSPSSGGGGSSAVAAQTISPAQLQLMHEQKGGSTVLPESTFGRTYQQPRRGIGGFFSGLGRGIGKMAMMFNPWTAAAGIMGNPKTAAFLNLMGRGKNKLQNIGGDVGEISNYPTLDRWLNRNTGKYDDKPYQGQGQGYDFKTDNLQTAIDRDLLNDPEQLYLQNPSKNYLSSIDLSKYDNAPPFMHDLEAKAPVDPASIYMDESIYDSVPINKGNDFPSDEEIFNERFVFKPGSRKDKRLRTLHNQKTEGLFWNDANQKEYQQLLKEDAAQTKYPKSVII